MERDSAESKLTSMNEGWEELATTTHQDHVIAHVIGTTVLGHFVFDEIAHLLLDIGFIWIIHLDGQMHLLTHPLVVDELEMDHLAKAEIKSDIGLLMNSRQDGLKRIIPNNRLFEISEALFYGKGEERRLEIRGENELLLVETSLRTREILIS